MENPENNKEKLDKWLDTLTSWLSDVKKDVNAVMQSAIEPETYLYRVDRHWSAFVLEAIARHYQDLIYQLYEETELTAQQKKTIVLQFIAENLRPYYKRRIPNNDPLHHLNSHDFIVWSDTMDYCYDYYKYEWVLESSEDIFLWWWIDIDLIPDYN